MGGGGKVLVCHSLWGGGKEQDLFYSQNKTLTLSKNFTAHVKPRFFNVNSNRKTAFQYFTCVAMQGWELANQRSMPHIPAADVCLTTDRGVQHLLLWEPTQQVPSAHRRQEEPNTPSWLGGSQWLQSTKRAALCLEVHGRADAGSLLCDYTFPPTQLSPVPVMAQRSTYVSCTCMHRNIERKKIPWASNTEIALKALSSVRATTVFSQLNSLPCGRVTTARALLSFISLFTSELALATSRP